VCVCVCVCEGSAASIHHAAHGNADSPSVFLANARGDGPVRVGFQFSSVALRPSMVLASALLSLTIGRK
jgi:hypothetical protein